MLFPLFPLSPERRDTLPCQTALTMALFDSPYEVATPRPSLAPHGQRQGPNFSLGFKAVPAAHTAPLLSQAAPQASGLPAEVPPSLPPLTPNAFYAPPHLPESWSPFKVKFRPHLFNEPLQDPSSCSVLSWAGGSVRWTRPTRYKCSRQRANYSGKWPELPHCLVTPWAPWAQSPTSPGMSPKVLHLTTGCYKPHALGGSFLQAPHDSGSPALPHESPRSDTGALCPTYLGIQSGTEAAVNILRNDEEQETWPRLGGTPETLPSVR